MHPENLKIYVAFHRKGKILSNDAIYNPLQVGRNISGLELDLLHDAEGENISGKNEIYSELTGWYWIWKNQKHNFIGTGHYRRYFTVSSPSFLQNLGMILQFFIGLKKKRHGLFYVRNTQRWRSKILTSRQVAALLNEFDAVLPQKKKFKYTVYEQYRRRHNENDILLTRAIISEKFPDYIESFDETFSSRQMYAFNMFVLPWNLFDEYMNWLFAILFELEHKANINHNDKYQKRVCAFMAERLQNVWINKKRLKVKELPVLYFKKLKTDHF